MSNPLISNERHPPLTLDRAKSLNTSEAIAARRQALDLAHMQPLVALVGIAKFSFQLLPVSLDPARNGWIAHFSRFA